MRMKSRIGKFKLVYILADQKRRFEIWKLKKINVATGDLTTISSEHFPAMKKRGNLLQME